MPIAVEPGSLHRAPYAFTEGCRLRLPAGIQDHRIFLTTVAAEYITLAQSLVQEAGNAPERIISSGRR
jgi:hypothetical protein